MREAERIADQLWRSLRGEAWHGPALLELLHDVRAEEAAARPVAGAHSIWELAEHVTTWSRFGTGRVEGREDKVSEAENFPAVAEVSDGAWDESRKALVAATEQLRDAILQLDDGRLANLVNTSEGGKVPLYSLLHGIVQHNLYHAGQIALLKRALRGQTGSV